MPRASKLILLFTLATVACNFATASATLTAPPPSATVAPTLTPAPTPTLTSTPSITYHLQASDVTFHPDPQLYSGDSVSFEISAANANPAWQNASVNVFADSQNTPPLASARFGAFGIGERAQATFFWAWDTQGRIGPQQLIVTVTGATVAEGDPPAAPLDVLTLTVNLLPAAQRPLPEPLAQWAEAESVCCVFHYLTHTAAARDIAHITATADDAFRYVEATLGVTRTERINFTLLSRLLGHGGFASQEISLTYIDRDPTASDMRTVFVHEGTHVLDRSLARTRPLLLTEGTAVYVAGGHFKPEDLDQRAAALLALNRYLPLTDLADNFYPAQHEIGYLEAGAFVKYLVDTFGWEAYKKFYGSFEEGLSQSQMLDDGLRANFGLSLAELETQWLTHLRALPENAAMQADLQLTIEQYDTLRRYQQQYDPAAHFLTAWLPDGPTARRRNIVADFVRHPTALENIALETMLAEAGRALAEQRFADADALLTSVNAVLDASGSFADPVAAQYLQLAAHAQALGFEAQAIHFSGETATLTAIRDWPTIDTITLTHTLSGWR